MIYDCLNGETVGEEEIDPNTINDLLDMCDRFPEHIFHFVGTELSPDTLHSWRGSYYIPAIGYSESYRVGKDIARDLRNDLKKVHYGYKGGEYRYTEQESFYVANYGRASEFVVVSYTIEENFVIMNTKILAY